MNEYHGVQSFGENVHFRIKFLYFLRLTDKKLTNLKEY